MPKLFSALGNFVLATSYAIAVNRLKLSRSQDLMNGGFLPRIVWNCFDWYN
jgi:hypothetical protein